MTETVAATARRTIVATRGDGGHRIDHVICRHVADVDHATRSRVQRWIRDGLVTINDRPVIRPAARAAAGDRIQLVVPAPRVRARMAAEPADLDVVFEDDHLLAVNKPAGVVVHPTYRHPSGTLMNALLWRARAWPSSCRPSLVGRLDRFTSGLVLVAKTAAVHASLQRTLSQPVSEKDYLALVVGRVDRARGTIDLALARDAHDRRRVVTAPGGRTALTRFERLGHASGVALVRCRLVTGRMHQIRVHLAASGWPIVGDRVYGDPRWQRVRPAERAAVLQAFPRQALHAWELAFPHPITGAPTRLRAPLPADFVGILRTCGLTEPRP